MKGKGIRSEEKEKDFTYDELRKSIEVELEDKEVYKEIANSEGSNTPWTKVEEKEREMLEYFLDLLERMKR